MKNELEMTNFNNVLSDAMGNGIAGNGLSGNGISGNGISGNGISGNGTPDLISDMIEDEIKEIEKDL